MNVVDPPVYFQLFPRTISPSRVFLCFVFFRCADLVVGPREFKGVANFSTFLLDRSRGMLFMGARDAILAVDIRRLDQPPKKVGRGARVERVLDDKTHKMQESDLHLRLISPSLMSLQISWEVPERKRQSCVTKGKTEVRGKSGDVISCCSHFI